MTVVTFASFDMRTRLEEAPHLSYYATQFIVFYQWVLGSNLLFVVVCRGGSTKAGEAGRINILVKKAASVVWLNMDSLEAQAEGGWRPNWTLSSTTPPTLLWTDAGTPFQDTPPSCKVPCTAPLSAPLCGQTSSSSFQSQVTSCFEQHLHELRVLLLWVNLQAILTAHTNAGHCHR